MTHKVSGGIRQVWGRVILKGAGAMQDSTFHRVRSGLQDQDPETRKAAIRACESPTVGMEKDLIREIAQRLKDRDNDVRRAAVRVLGQQKDRADNEMIQRLDGWLNSELWYVRCSSLSVLEKWRDRIGSRVMGHMVDALLDEDWRIRLKTLDILREVKSKLPQAKIQEIAGWVNHERRDCRIFALRALGILSPRVEGPGFQKIVHGLADKDPAVRITSLGVLVK